MAGTKMMLTIDPLFLARVDEVAKEEHRTRSELIREAVRHYTAASKEARNA